MDSNNKTTKLDIATWLSFMMFATSAIIVAVCLPEISNTFSTNLAEGGGMETARSLVLIAILLLAGLLAQRWGRKRFLTLGQYLIAAGLLLGSVAQNYATLVLSAMIIGAGAGFLEALLNPLIVDMHPRESGKYLNIGHAFHPIGVMTSALLFGELLTLGVSWRLLFQVAAVGALIVAVLFTVLKFPPQEKEESSYLGSFAGILARRGFWLFAAAIFLGAGIESAFLFWNRSYVTAYLSDVPRSGALAVVIFSAAMASGRFLAGYLSNKTSLNNIMLSSALLGVVVGSLFTFSSTLFGFYAVIALAGLATACFWPTIMAEAGNYLPVNKTVLFILLACAGTFGFGLTPWIMGMIGDASGLRSGFAIIPLLFVTLTVILIIERRMSRKKSWVVEQEHAAV